MWVGDEVPKKKNSTALPRFYALIASVGSPSLPRSTDRIRTALAALYSTYTSVAGGPLGGANQLTATIRSFTKNPGVVVAAVPVVDVYTPTPRPTKHFERNALWFVSHPESPCFPHLSTCASHRPLLSSSPPPLPKAHIFIVVAAIHTGLWSWWAYYYFRCGWFCVAASRVACMMPHRSPTTVALFVPPQWRQLLRSVSTRGHVVVQDSALVPIRAGTDAARAPSPACPPM